MSSSWAIIMHTLSLSLSSLDIEFNDAQSLISRLENEGFVQASSKGSVI